jgi:CheY-like chemotaxis protein
MPPSLRALIVDDADYMRLLLAFQLKGLGYTVVDVPHALAALDLLHRDSAFDVIFTDYAMPGMNGVGFIEQVKACYPRIALVLITASMDTRRLHEAVQKGALAYLSRPYLKDQLVAILEQVQGDKKPVKSHQRVGERESNPPACFGHEGLPGHFEQLRRQKLLG